MAADVGTGLAINFATSSFTAELMDTSASGISREDIQTSHMGTTGYHTFIPSKIVDGGEISFEMNFNPDQIPPVDQPIEQITITFPLPEGKTTAATVQFPGYIREWEWTAPFDDKMTGTGTIKVAGDPTWTASA